MLYIIYNILQEFKKLAPLWDEFITNEAKIYQEFHDYWMKLAEQIPILCVRYEDILQDQKVIEDKCSLEVDSNFYLYIS